MPSNERKSLGPDYSLEQWTKDAYEWNSETHKALIAKINILKAQLMVMEILGNATNRQDVLEVHRSAKEQLDKLEAELTTIGEQLTLFSEQMEEEK
jgi:hypothetical protein